MAIEPQRLTDPERANLVAYLDGELNEAEARALGNKLTLSMTGRREVDALQKTWELLDYLPRPEPPADFAERTITQALDLGPKGATLAQQAGRAGRVGARVLAVAAVALLMLGASYAATRWLWPDPTARLAQDLSIAEHLGEYQEVGSFDFLRRLDESSALEGER